MNVQDTDVPADVIPSTRERILDAASSLIADRGYAATSISALSKQAKVQPASIYWAFGSKEGVLSAVIDHSATQWLAEHGPAIRAAASIDLWEGLRSLAPLFDQQPEFLRLLLVLSLERRDGDPAVLEAARRVRADVIDGLAGLFLEAIDLPDRDECRRIARDLSRLLVMLLDGSFIARQIEPDETDLSASFELIIDALKGALEGQLRRSATLTDPEHHPDPERTSQ